MNIVISKFKIVFTVLFSIAILTSCSKVENKFKVGMLFGYYDAPRYARENAFFEEKIKELGGEYIVKITNGDEIIQHNQALELIEEGVDIIVIIPVNVNTAASIVRDAHIAGIKVFAYDRLIRNCELDFFMTFNEEKTGEFFALHTINKVAEGNYVLLNGDATDANVGAMFKGEMKVLKPLIDSKKINVVYAGNVEGWKTENSAFITDKVLEFSNKKIDVVLSTYNSLVDGVNLVLEKRGLTDSILVVGNDVEIGICSRILHNSELMAIYKPEKSFAYKGAEIAAKLVSGQKIESMSYTFNGRIEVPSYIHDPIVVTKENIESTVIADGFLTMDELVNYSASKK